MSVFDLNRETYRPLHIFVFPSASYRFIDTCYIFNTVKPQLSEPSGRHKIGSDKHGGGGGGFG